MGVVVVVVVVFNRSIKRESSGRFYMVKGSALSSR